MLKYSAYIPTFYFGHTKFNIEEKYLRVGLHVLATCSLKMPKQ